MAQCPRQAKLRIEGKEHAQAETALVRGLVAHKCLEHGCSVAEAWDAVMADLIDEGRAVTAAVAAGRETIESEVADVVLRYLGRIAPLMEELVGVELPVSIEIGVDGMPVVFESHIDKLYIGADPLTGERSAVILDWKWHQSAPTSAYLTRNLQLGMYQYAVMHGGLHVDGWPWSLPEDLPLACYWVHLPHLKPYARKTTVNKDGADVTYAKGDERPMRRVCYAATVTDWGRLEEGFAERVRMMRANFWPAIPEPTRCFICRSSYACAAWGNYA